MRTNVHSFCRIHTSWSRYLESFSAQRALETSRFGRGRSAHRWRNQWRRLLEMLVARQRCRTTWVGIGSSRGSTCWRLETAAWRGSLDKVEGQCIGTALTVVGGRCRCHRTCTPARATYMASCARPLILPLRLANYTNNYNQQSTRFKLQYCL